MLLDYEIWKTSSMLFQKFPYNEGDSLESVKDDEDFVLCYHKLTCWQNRCQKDMPPF